MHLLADGVAASAVRATPDDPTHYETCVVTAVRRDFYGIAVYYTTAFRWDELGVRSGFMDTHKFGSVVRRWIGPVT